MHPTFYISHTWHGIPQFLLAYTLSSVSRVACLIWYLMERRQLPNQWLRICLQKIMQTMPFSMTRFSTIIYLMLVQSTKTLEAIPQLTQFPVDCKYLSPWWHRHSVEPWVPARISRERTLVIDFVSNDRFSGSTQAVPRKHVVSAAASPCS